MGQSKPPTAEDLQRSMEAAKAAGSKGRRAEPPAPPEEGQEAEKAKEPSRKGLADFLGVQD